MTQQPFQTGSRQRFRWRARNRVVELGSRTALVGVVNITPDSFSDGGRYLDRQQAVDRCLELVEQGADILDLGGESSRPGSVPVSAVEEMDRLLPVLSQVRGRVSVPISIDTYKAEVAEAALQLGADIINDISAFRMDSRMPRVAASFQAGVVLMHMRGVPSNMQEIEPSRDILVEIHEQLKQSLQTAYSWGIQHDRIVLDPGIGFGKTVEDNLLILNRLSSLAGFGLPVMVGTSRKSFLGKILGLSEAERIWGTASSLVVSIVRGAHLVRVHDVAEMRMVVDTVDAILEIGLE